MDYHFYHLIPLKISETLVASDPRSRTSIEGARWAGFANFNRTVPMGFDDKISVMKSIGEVKDVLPGTYKHSNFFRFSDIPVLKPRYTEVRGVKWVTNKETGKGSLQFPPDFDVLSNIEVELGTSEFVSYYGCCITNTRQDDEVTLEMRHAIEDFRYSPNYLQDWILNKNGNNGAGVERHAFSHIDLPKDRDNGIFLLGKFEDDEETILHLTGFHIPQRHCLFVPGGVIHINDYLKGTWRTMLSDAAPIDYVYLEKGGVKFHFQFSI